ncbi:hypothetical protein [Herbaspirillum sp. B65]|jgi:hypothetical protein|uniref:hypothetical protein n=1 Tax=Herbaspirillum sp. B65 TaxID=137708 RepID=UPI00131F4340|nr:hypothetical protein [Herbaspirillum sp. B65]
MPGLPIAARLDILTDKESREDIAQAQPCTPAQASYNTPHGPTQERRPAVDKKSDESGGTQSSPKLANPLPSAIQSARRARTT